jgi:predicted RNA binding protein YcfA (HicA-like mRNA interferase family)
LYVGEVSSTLVIKMLRAAGWYFVRSKGSHHHFSHLKRPGSVVSVPHPKKDIGFGLLKAIEKQSGVRLLP